MFQQVKNYYVLILYDSNKKIKDFQKQKNAVFGLFGALVRRKSILNPLIVIIFPSPVDQDRFQGLVMASMAPNTDFLIQKINFLVKNSGGSAA